MTSSSPEVGRQADYPPAFSGRELRFGGWTRLVGGSVLGDEVTEHALTGLAAEARAAASAQGYATGWSEGRRAAEERARETERTAAEQRRREDERRENEHRQAVDALVTTASRLEEAFAGLCARVESHATALAVSLTEELLGHELAVAETPGLDAVRRALTLLPGEPVVRVRVCPEEAATPGLVELAGAAVVVADPRLGRGDVVLETGEAIVDARVSSAMQRVREVLLP